MTLSLLDIKVGCANSNGGCQHNCVDTIGSHYCTCVDGYTLNEDDHGCTQILAGLSHTIRIDSIAY